jgi:putative ABC transport system substrate-binding protein
MVLDRIHQQIQQRRGADFAGVLLDIPVAQQIDYLKQVLPSTRRVGYIHGPEMEDAHRQAAAAAQAAGIRLIAEKVLTERDILDALRRLISQVDVFWMPADPMMYEAHVFQFVVVECFKNGVPIVSVYRSRAEAGIPIAIGVDYEDIGRQTAELVIRRLQQGRFENPPIIHPRKLLYYINEGVVSSLNLDLDIPLDLPLVPVRSGS